MIPEKSATHLFGAHTAAAKNIFPRLAGLLEVSQISDITAVKGEDTFQRPIYAGNAILTLKSSAKDSVKIVTVRGTAFDKAKKEGGSASVEEVSAADASCEYACVEGEQHTDACGE